jgi:hypothetical protein
MATHIDNNKIENTKDIHLDDDLVLEENFPYKVNALAGQVKPYNIWDRITSPKNLPATKMYLMFVIGTIVLIILTYLTVNDVQFYGSGTYVEYFQKYFSRDGSAAAITIIIMVFINIFWIIVNILIEFLAGFQEWIPPKVDTKYHSVHNVIKGRGSNLVGFTSKYYFNEELEKEKERLLCEKEADEDMSEYRAILDNAALSPLAFLWAFVKRIYRFFIRLPRRISFITRRLLVQWEKDWIVLVEFLRNSWDLLIYFLNPFNIIEEIIDVSITILVRILYPTLLTPIIFFFPMKNNFFFDNLIQIIIYFILIGGLRMGVEFFSIYIRFLRNTRYNANM